MNAKIRKIIDNKMIRITTKIVFCLLIVAWFCSCLFTKSFDSYFSYNDYFYQNDFVESVSGDGLNSIEQHFVAKGNILSNITIYLGDINDAELSIHIIDKFDNVICSKEINVSDYNANTWNRISIDCGNLIRNDRYSVLLKGDNLSYIVLSKTNEYPEIFSKCDANGDTVSYAVALGLQFTYKYMTNGSRMELIVLLIFNIVLAVSLCYTVMNIEKMYFCFVSAEKKKGFLYALYFSLHTTFLFNPLDISRNEVTEFGRIIGAGLNAGVDVSKRVGNFSQWFICFAMTFVLYYLLANYLKGKELSGENKKAALLLDNVIIIADITMGFRCLTFFYGELNLTNVFYYSDYIMMNIVLLLIAYILFGLEKQINLDQVEAIIISAWMLVLPFAIAVMPNWAMGRGFMGFQVLISILIVLGIRLLELDFKGGFISRVINIVAVFMSLIPFGTSFYIELLCWLNQHEIFWVNICEKYIFLVGALILVTVVTVFIMIKNKKYIEKWKSFAYIMIVFGFACLWKQIPISAEYNADLFETANSSILISDFLNFGDIPIVQHYGGHMMSGVWEGLIYAILNNDSAGAVLSPYYGYVATIIAVSFYLFIKHIWDEDVAIIVVLFMPFYNSISYWGLGLLTVLAVGAYVKKNTYLRAFLFWFICIWCAIYRLDLGAAFIVACIISLVLYIIFEKNTQAFKQLLITLIGFGCIGVGAWFCICIVKDVNPINRLLEFLYIGFSNLNWAYAGIGDTSLTMFAWAYVLVPLSVCIGILYLIFSADIRKNKEKTIWVMLLTIGFSYIYNFSRGLVRHSLAEGVFGLTVSIWSAYLFLALVLAILFRNKKLIFPVFAVFILINASLSYDTVFTEDSIVNQAISHIGDYTENWMSNNFTKEEKTNEQNLKSYWDQVSENKEVIQRVKWNSDLVNTVDEYRVMIDALLEDGETFVDFINKTTIYSLLNRRNPAYVSQSPLQLSGQFTQEQFIKEIQGIPIVLMPCDNSNSRLSESLDGVPNSYRYYKVSEYIYQNYVPLCSYKDIYAIWCLPERYDEMSIKIQNMIAGKIDLNENIKLIEYGYDGPYLQEDGENYSYLPAVHNYNIGKLPVIWAESDSKKSVNNNVITELDYADGLYTYKMNPLLYGTDGNYLKVSMTYDGLDKSSEFRPDDEEIGATIKLGKMVNGKFETKYVYSFTVKEGKHNYMFRVSNDYYWYLGVTDSVKLECDGQLVDVNMEILEGD